MSFRIEKLNELKRKRLEGLKDSQVLSEGVVVKRKGVEEKKRKFEEIQARKDLLSTGIDLTRHDNLQYTIEDTLAWNDKLSRKQESMDTDYKSYTSTAARKYRKDVKELNVAHIDGSGVTDGHDVSYGSWKDTDEGINNLVSTLKRQDEKYHITVTLGNSLITHRKKQFSRRREFKDDEDVTFINERNRNFNKKIGRAYDKFTKEIKDSFERGTAL